jgi:hypothetical protein
LPKIPSLRNVRSFDDQRLHILYTNNALNDNQLSFLFGRELAFKYLNFSPRTYTASPLEIRSVDEVLNNFYASYVSSALIIPKTQLIQLVGSILKSKTFNAAQLMDAARHYHATEEMFLQRLTNILPHHFGLDDLFFLKFEHQISDNSYTLVKELHLSGLHNPHAVATNEHYCRRWISLSLLKQLEEQGKDQLAGIQRSSYHDSDNEYLILTLARSGKPSPEKNNSLSIGILLNENTKRKIRFWNDTEIPIREVNETCERCPISDCAERAAPPVHHLRKQKQEKIKSAIQELIWNSTD